MSEFEKILSDMCDSKDERRVDRIEGHQGQLHLTAKQAILFDNTMFAMVKGCIAGLGAAVDGIDDPIVKGAALIAFPHILAKNVTAVIDVITIVGIQTAMADDIVPNPNKPDCDCANCVGVRAIAHTLIEADNAHAAQD